MTGTTRYSPGDHLGDRSLLVAASYVVLLRGTDRGTGAPEVLLQLRQGTGYLDGHWATLAGHVDPGESVHEAAVREADEEAGIRIAPGDLEPLTVLHRFERGGPQVEQRCDVFFVVRTWSGEPAVREADKAAAMAWFSLDALPEPVVPHERLVLDGVRTGALPAVLSLPT
ncbi:MAG TPA: NUDIX domain-containing protein [Cellulomonas sp.]